MGLMVGCVAALAIPSVADSLIYERDAIARGEWWRLVTGHIVHYSAPHLLNNLLVVLPAALLIEMRQQRELMRLVTLAAIAIGVAIFVLEPGISRYAGASGISFALITYVALHGISGNPRWRIVCGSLLVLVAAKLAAEGLFGWQWINWEREGGFVTVTLAHVTGVASGLLVWSMQIISGRQARLTGVDISRVNSLRQV